MLSGGGASLRKFLHGDWLVFVKLRVWRHVIWWSLLKCFLDLVHARDFFKQIKRLFIAVSFHRIWYVFFDQENGTAAAQWFTDLNFSTFLSQLLRSSDCHLSELLLILLLVLDLRDYVVRARRVCLKITIGGQARLLLMSPVWLLRLAWIYFQHWAFFTPFLIIIFNIINFLKTAGF